jgi:hypothetical protein
MRLCTPSGISKRVGQFYPSGYREARSQVCASMADRDLTRFVIPDGGAFQDFSLVLVPGIPLCCLARA